MKIPGMTNDIAKYVKESTATRVQKSAAKVQAPTGVRQETEGDAIVNVSQRSKEVYKAQEVIQATPDVRAEKVQALKKKIENGNYQIDYDKTAEKMIEVSRDENI